MVQEKRCRRIQPTQGAAGSSFQLKDGGSSIVFAKSTYYQFMMLEYYTCMVVLVGLLQDGPGYDPVGSLG